MQGDCLSRHQYHSAFVLNQPPLLKEWDRWKYVLSSELMGVEARRTLDRWRLSGVLEDDDLAYAHDRLTMVEEGLDIIDVSRSVLQRASMPMPTVIKTLDAIHLATAMLWREQEGQSLIFATHDEKLGIAARALDFSVLGVYSNVAHVASAS